MSAPVNFGDPRLPDRFWDNVSPCPMSGCWLWTGHLVDGYGKPRVRGPKTPAHRLSYTATVGRIATGLELDHTCRVRSCVNPAHLEPVTHRVNTLRGEGITAKAARATHCPRGHAFNDANTIIEAGRGGRPRRRCRTCQRARGAEWARQRRAA